MNGERPSIFRYWAAGMLFGVVAWLALIPIAFLGGGFFGFLMHEYPNIAVVFVYSLSYVILIPYVFGRIIK